MFEKTEKILCLITLSNASPGASSIDCPSSRNSFTFFTIANKQCPPDKSKTKNGNCKF